MRRERTIICVRHLPTSERPGFRRRGLSADAQYLLPVAYHQVLALHSASEHVYFRCMREDPLFENRLPLFSLHPHRLRSCSPDRGLIRRSACHLLYCAVNRILPGWPKRPLGRARATCKPARETTFSLLCISLTLARHASITAREARSLCMRLYMYGHAYICMPSNSTACS